MRDGIFTAENGEEQAVKLMYSDEYTYLADGQAQGLLKDMIAAGLFPEKYEIRTPSLHEIFVDCVTKSGDTED